MSISGMFLGNMFNGPYGSNKDKNAFVLVEDSGLIKIYSKTECIDKFGLSVFEENGVFIPEDLVENYRRALVELQKTQDQILSLTKK